MEKCKVLEKGKTIINFCNNHIQNITDTKQIAEEVTKYFGLFHPIILDNLITTLENAGIEVKDDAPPTSKARGFNSVCADKISIHYKKIEAPCSKVFTILHELYEIILQKLTEKDRKLLEKDADLFASLVVLPDELALEWIANNGLDVFGLTKKMNCSYSCSLLRINYALNILSTNEKWQSLSMIGILYERFHWQPSNKPKRLIQSRFTKSAIFPLNITKSKEMKTLKFLIPTKTSSRIMTLDKVINIFSNEKKDSILIANTDLFFGDTTLKIDLLIRTLNWENYEDTAKVLFQIVPADCSALRDLSARLEIRQI